MINLIKARHDKDEEAVLKYKKVVSGIDDYLISLNPPTVFRGANSALIQVDKSFEHLCTVLEEAGIEKPKSLTVFEFHSKIDFFEKRNVKK